jgi:hypothetical protein
MIILTIEPIPPPAETFNEIPRFSSTLNFVVYHSSALITIFNEKVITIKFNNNSQQKQQSLIVSIFNR